MSDAIPSRPPLSPAEGWNPPSRDFFGGPPPVDPANIPEPTSEHEFLHGEVLPDAVAVPGAFVTPPKQARVDSGQHQSSSTAGLAAVRRGRSVKNAQDAMALGLEALGLPPGAVHYATRELTADVEAASARARAFEVIARAAVAYVDVGGSAEADALAEAVAENRAAIS